MKNLFIMLTLITFVASFAHAANEPEDSLILYVSFDALNDEDQAIDHSKYKNHGDLKGNPELVAGKYGKAIELDGQSQWVEIPHHETLTVDKDVTAMAWINVERHSGPGGVNWQGIVSKGNSPRSYSFYTHLPTQCLHLSIGPAGAFGASTCNTAISLNEWQHVAAQLDSGTHRYWINGVNAGVSSGKPDPPGNADTSNVFIGTTAEGAGRLLLGLIDEVRIWNRALTEDEINEQMDKGYLEFLAVDPKLKLATTWSNLKAQQR